MHITIPSGAARILSVLESHGFEAFVVGGCVRDSLLGRDPNDWDITTSALPQEVKALFPRTIDTGLRHGTVTVLMAKEAYEVTTYRVDGAYLDRRHPSEVTFTSSLQEDLQRRDFTINAMAYSEGAGLQDFFGGMADLDAGLVRAVGAPERRFGEDALRILRAVRFSAQLGYSIEEKTFLAMRELAPTLEKISAERIAAELTRLLASPHPEKIREAWACGVTRAVLPEFDRCMETEQHNPHHCYSVGDHTIHALSAVRPDKVLRWAVLLHDFGKPACRTTDGEGVDHFYGHPEEGARVADAILRRLKFDNETRRRVVRLVRFHDRKARLTRPGVRRAVMEIGEDIFPLYLEIQEADMAAQSDYQRQEKKAHLDQVRRIYAEIVRAGDCLSLAGLAVSGDDLLAAGMRPGKEVGQTLSAMLEDVVENPSHNEKNYLLRMYIPGKTQ